MSYIDTNAVKISRTRYALLFSKIILRIKYTQQSITASLAKCMSANVSCITVIIGALYWRDYASLSHIITSINRWVVARLYFTRWRKINALSKEMRPPPRPSVPQIPRTAEWKPSRPPHRSAASPAPWSLPPARRRARPTNQTQKESHHVSIRK